MKYIWNAEQFSVSFREAAMRLLKWQNTDKGRDFVKQALSYFLWKWPYKRENLKMDRSETLLSIFHSFCHAGLVPTSPVLTQICIFRHDIAPYRMVRSDRNF